MAFLLGLIPGIISAVSAAAPAIGAIAGGVGAVKSIADFGISLADRKKKQQQQKAKDEEEAAEKQKFAHEEDEVNWLFDREQKKYVDEEVAGLKYAFAHPAPAPGMKEWMENAKKPEFIEKMDESIIRDAKKNPGLYDKDKIDRVNKAIYGFTHPASATSSSIPIAPPPPTPGRVYQHAGGLKIAEHVHKHLMKNFVMNEPARRQLAFEFSRRKFPEKIKYPLIKMVGSGYSQRRTSRIGRVEGAGIKDVLLSLYHKFKPGKKEVVNLLIKLSKEFLDRETHDHIVSILSHFTSESHFHGDGLKDFLLTFSA